MSYQLKIALYAATLIAAAAGAVLLSWAYLEVQHADEHQELVDCIRVESRDGGWLPVQQVVESSISTCEGEQWLVR